ncbi:zincin-like metallopeptidase domain-containing protein [Luteimonas sp. MC1750]|uniref:ArdC family protein n=1 Tax=Luteimonas sp. MC1750 TaxID=2799326 RepID=UPI0018F0C073|nr:zincin-like metallopeptidase domain-containing protein [Luteimonas sp. MC1750]MBJ6984011.1 elongation factor P hydroxylase [Luteimonas sp. MC1750]QQO06823.1 elongation factor P hydroxylase [Luteimonas sp. MC1750]
MKYADLALAQAKVLIELMKQGKPFLPVLKPGDPSTIANLPYNPTTGKAYRGGNRVMLYLVGMTNGYEDNRWLTYKQAQSVGAQVKKGAKSVPLRYVMFPNGQEAEQATVVQPWMDKPRTFFFNVFNAEDIDGLPPPPQRPETTPAQRIERCEALLAASGAVIVHGASQPHYAPKADKIGLPYPERFVSPDAYYAVALHELAHWSGHETRLARDLTGAFGSESYAKEEMIAETASHLMGVELGIGHDPSQHAAYIHHWMKIAGEDPSFLYTAAAAAEKVCDFVGLERFSYEPMLPPEPEVEVSDVAIPALEDAAKDIAKVAARAVVPAAEMVM